ncbi:hypothetical protein BB934_15410 [Microvirga ossetica]|uniref:Flagellar hook-length control protein-like C-terminal domain-containing protein n=1 Tax=Microvirga ossetica TaxID=1882682 RepID=A0A1B2EHI8_9HYPH|nr:flagellar hook-length control protein FliK [Microvirga ossetica]ANY79436.1 hypothetical protein BB934_15410 [Microvirga ossetica]
MSRLDILPQAAPRFVDTPSARGSSATPDGQGSSGNSAAQGFDALLEGLSGNLQKDGNASASDVSTLAGDEADRATGEPAPDDSDSLQALLSNALTDNGFGDATGFQASGAALATLEALLPRILEQASNGERVGDRQSGSSSGVPNLLLLQQGSEEIDLANPGLGARLPIDVQKQETHFRPIVEGFDLASSNPEAVDPSEPGPVVNDVLTRALKAAGSGGLQQSDRTLPTQAAPAEAVDSASAQTADEREGINRISPGTRNDRSDVQGPSPAGGTKAEGTSLPPATLQQIAGTIIDDAESLSGSQPTSLPGDGSNRVATAKASAGALRVLHLQLKPAELGLVTIKMRLAGDGLEMELQTESEETAELLRNDAEKLSSLLRVSGYRPDAITIHSTEAAAHDRSSFQRPQQGSQSQGQSFEQGAASGQGDSSRHRQGQQERGGPDVRKGSDQAQTPGSSGSGGVYL